jgi:hypothetical protein
MRHIVLKERLSNWKAIHWVFLGLGVVAFLLLAGFVVLVGAAATALDTNRDLEDFESPQQAREFVSAHLPTPLPATAVVQELNYERWTDWHLKARVRFESAAALTSYMGQARLDRTLDDAYCGGTEPSGSVRYFLTPSFACGKASVAEVSGTLDIVCHTR